MSDAPVYRAAFILAHFHPARHFLKGAQAAATHIIPQNRGAVPDTRAL